MALAQLEQFGDINASSSEWLVERMKTVLKPRAGQGIHKVTNDGAVSAADAVQAVGQDFDGRGQPDTAPWNPYMTVWPLPDHSGWLRPRLSPCC
ncbi:hypothetical protein R6V09_12840 [Streptomyces sp. W16]|nr:hypothetical protein [Streptomyces sp. W16]